VRRHHDVREREDRVLRRRFFLEHVERGAGDGAFLERVVERGLVHDTAAGHVNEVGGRLHLLQGARVHHGGGLRGAWDVQRDEVGGREDLIQAPGALDVHGAHPVLGDVRVVGEHPHPHPHGAPGDDGPHVPEPYEPEGFLGDLDAFEGAPIPLSTPQRAVRSRDAPRRGEHQSEGVLGGGNRVARGGVGDQDSVLGRRLYVYVVHPDAGSPDGLEVLRPLYYLRRNAGRAADYEAVVLAYPLQ
jgi:hypothetical protein